MKRRITFLLLASVLILALPLTAVAQQPGIVRAEQLKAFQVRNSKGEDLGKIDDMLAMMADGRLPFVAVSFGGVLGIGKTVVPVPRQAIQLKQPDGVAIIDIPADVLKKAPTIDPNNWPPTAVKGWDTQFLDYWRNAGIQVDLAATDPLTANKGQASPAEGPALTVAVGAVRLSEMKNFGLTNKDNERLGTLDDMIIAWQPGKVTHLIVRLVELPPPPPSEGQAPAAAPAAPPAAKLVPIPWGALMLDPLNKKFVLNISANDLKNAPSFDEGKYPDLNNADWDKPYRDFWTKK